MRRRAPATVGTASSGVRDACGWTERASGNRGPLHARILSDNPGPPTPVHLISVAGELLGERALVYLPGRGQARPDEVLLSTGQITGIDAWGGNVLRTTIEYYATYQQVNVVLTPPKDGPVWGQLCGLLGELPAHVILKDGRETETLPNNVVLPAQRIRTFDQLDAVSQALFNRAAALHTMAEATILTNAIQAFGGNALRHARSPIQAVVTSCFERSEDELQLVATDLGAGISEEADPAAMLLKAIEDAEDGEVSDLAQLATRRELDITLAFASGTGRVYWRAGRWSTAADQYASGLTAAITIHR